MHIYIYRERDWFTFCLFSIYPNPLAQAICSWLPPIVVSILPRTMLFEYWKKQVCVFLCMRCSQQNITNKNSGLLSSDPPCISFVVARHNHVLLGKKWSQGDLACHDNHRMYLLAILWQLSLYPSFQPTSEGRHLWNLWSYHRLFLCFPALDTSW